MKERERKKEWKVLWSWTKTLSSSWLSLSLLFNSHIPSFFLSSLHFSSYFFPFLSFFLFRSFLSSSIATQTRIHRERNWMQKGKEGEMNFFLRKVIKSQSFEQCLECVLNQNYSKMRWMIYFQVCLLIHSSIFGTNGRREREEKKKKSWEK